MLQKMTRILVLMAMAMFLSAGAVQAAKMVVVSAPVNLVEYMSGGIGKGERDSMEKMADAFDMKLVFADDQGRYLSDVIVLVQDSDGETVIHSVSNGPWFYADLPDGKYTVTAVFAKEAKTADVSVDKGLNTRRFTWELTSDS